MHLGIEIGGTSFGGALRAPARQGPHVSLDDMGIVESIHLTAFHWSLGWWTTCTGGFR